VRTGLLSEVGGLIGKKGADAIESALTMSDPHTKGLLASGIAIATLILTATGLFIELQSDLNLIWGVEVKPGQGVRGFIKNRLLTFAMVVAIGFLLMVSLVLSAVIAALGHYFNSMAPGLNAIWTIVNLLVSFGVITVLFAMVFKILPDVNIAWRDVWIGAGFTAFLFTAGKFLLGLYLGKNSTVSAYGAAGALVLILLWVYYSAQILFFGAELAQVYANRYGVRLEPKSHARWVSPPEQRSDPETTSSKRKVQLVLELREEVECLRSMVKS
jgi:membrane protein